MFTSILSSLMLTLMIGLCIHPCGVMPISQEHHFGWYTFSLEGSRHCSRYRVAAASTIIYRINMAFYLELGPRVLERSVVAPTATGRRRG